MKAEVPFAALRAGASQKSKGTATAGVRVPSPEGLARKLRTLPLLEQAAVLTLAECMIANPGMRLPDPKRIQEVLFGIEPTEVAER